MGLRRLWERTKHQLLEWFVLGVPVYRQRYRGRDSAPANERSYRLVRAMCAYQEELRGQLAGQWRSTRPTSAMLATASGTGSTRAR